MSHRWLLVAILALAAFLRFFQLSKFPPGLYRDEAMDGNDAAEVLETHRFQVFFPEDGGREGLYVDVAALSIAAFGNRPWALRLPAAIFGVLTVWGLYLLAAEFVSIPVGLLAAFFLATSFWHLVFSRIAFRAIGAPLVLVWSLYLLLVSLRRAREGRPFIDPILLAGVIYGLGFYTYPAYRITPLLVMAIWFSRKHQNQRVAALLFATAAAAVAAPLAAYFVTHPGTFWGRADQVSVFGGPQPAFEILLNFWRTARMLFTRGDHNWRHNIAWRAELYWPVAVTMVMGVWVASKRCRLILFWLLLAMVPAVLATECPHALRSILILPAVCILAALGSVRLYEWLGRTVPARVLRTGSAAILLALCFEPYHSYFDVWARNPKTDEAFDSTYTDFAGRIAAAPPGQTKVVVIADRSSIEIQSVMFLTGSYTERQRREKRIVYVEGESTATACRPNQPPESGALIFCLP